MLGFNSNLVKSGKRYLGHAIHNGEKTTRFIGHAVKGVRDLWNMSKKGVRTIADKADNTLQTQGALRNVANIGIQNLGSSTIGNLLKAGVNETDYINKRITSSLRTPLLQKFINS